MPKTAPKSVKKDVKKAPRSTTPKPKHTATQNPCGTSRGRGRGGGSSGGRGGRGRGGRGGRGAGNLPVEKIIERNEIESSESETEADRLNKHFRQEFDSDDDQEDQTDVRNDDDYGADEAGNGTEADKEEEEEGSVAVPEELVVDKFEDEDEYEWRCRLLEQIQEYPEIFDLASPRYKNKFLKQTAWDEIYAEMNCTGMHS